MSKSADLESIADATRLLAVDIGNHQIKLGRYPSRRGDGFPHPSPVWRIPNDESAANLLPELLPAEPLLWSVATVHRRAEGWLAAWVARNRPRDRYRLLRHDDLPLAIHVAEPNRVGADRLLAAVAVNHLRSPGRPAIVVDAGTAITVDLISGEGAFEGGVILPGFRLIAKALADGTDLLPEVTFDPTAEPPPVIGKSTTDAIRSGLFWGQIGAVGELVRRMSAREISARASQSPQVFIAGGDAARLAAYLADARVVEELVLGGIWLTSVQLAGS